MVNPDAIARRLLALNEALQHLNAKSAEITAERLATDPLLQAAVERWLQVSVEACIDIAYHVISEQGWTPPDAARSAFATLTTHGVIPNDLAERLTRAAGMRNILVHDYVRVDRAILAAAVKSALADLRAFGAIAGTLIAPTDD
jgi:uncharacterized protein YutE (UPF0331/DUF86 family)